MATLSWLTMGRTWEEDKHGEENYYMEEMGRFPS
jgi:hypothetical protein